MTMSMRTHFLLVSNPQPADSAKTKGQRRADAQRPIASPWRCIVAPPRTAAGGNRRQPAELAARHTRLRKRAAGGDQRSAGRERVRGKREAERRRGRGRARMAKEARHGGCRDGRQEARGGCRGDGCGGRPTRRLTEGREANVSSVRRCRSRPRSTQALGFGARGRFARSRNYESNVRMTIGSIHGIA
jgi:hypothetical protein